MENLPGRLHPRASSDSLQNRKGVLKDVEGGRRSLRPGKVSKNEEDKPKDPSFLLPKVYVVPYGCVDEGEGIEVGSSVPARGETDDVVMVNVPASNSPDPEDYELKDLLPTIFEAEMERLRHLFEISYSITFRMPENREGPLQGRE
ncbi:hypothetical protein FNV43_RR27250 [Rhamnella rubrinervis]|uniref:Uncharacterized protein n=1 Tax=Rhamnella rubrinervis TaxID=2594499 RepID=A0A8K0DRG3_9ROSA|nr:hypothetical protein FNV43_RR27250 [Rhamnella rubrinervis]